MAKQIYGVTDIFNHLDADGNYVDKKPRKKRTEKREPTLAQKRSWNRFACASKFSNAIMTTDIKKFWDVKYMTEANYFMKENMKAFNSKGKIEDYSLLKIVPNAHTLRANIVCTIRRKTINIQCKENFHYMSKDEMTAVILVKGDTSHRCRLEYLNELKNNKAKIDISEYKRGSTLELFLMNYDERYCMMSVTKNIEIKL